MKKLLLTALLGLWALATVAGAESYSSRQCPNFSTTEQPYLYLYTAEHYQGAPLYITNASIPNLGDVRIGMSYSNYFNDKAASLRVRGKWRVCTNSSYGGKCADVQSDDWKSEKMMSDLKAVLGGDFEKSITSVRLTSCSQY